MFNVVIVVKTFQSKQIILYLLWLIQKPCRPIRKNQEKPFRTGGTYLAESLKIRPQDVRLAGS